MLWNHAWVMIVHTRRFCSPLIVSAVWLVNSAPGRTPMVLKKTSMMKAATNDEISQTRAEVPGSVLAPRMYERSDNIVLN